MVVMDKTINNYALAIDEYHQSSGCKHAMACYKTDPDKSSYRPISERVNASLDNSLMISENVEMSK